MRHPLRRPLLPLALFAAAAAGCLTTSTPEDPGGPDYSDFDPVEGTPTQTDAGLLGTGGQDAAPWATNDAGSTGGTGGTGGTFDAGNLPRDASVADTGAGFDAGVQDSGTGVIGGGGLTSCAISANTDASGKLSYNGKYGCAVWVGDASKKVVKAFKVATLIASRTGLPAYRSASSGVTVDVVTGATLNQAVQHRYTWTGTPLPAGNYTLNVETHSSSGVNLVSIPFSTGAGSVDATGTPNGDVKSASITCM